ncbi:putative high mobility group protein B3 [Cryptosporidium felis]|nr:putative high mobility group protein B3 [Cryptosporidium felis]
MTGDDLAKRDSATLWSIVIKTAYRKRRCKRRSDESKDNTNKNNAISNDPNPGNELYSSTKNANYITGSKDEIKNSGDDLLRFLMDSNLGSYNSGSISDSNFSAEGVGKNNENENFLNELFSNDRLDGNSGSKLSIDCKGEIVFDEGLTNSSNKQVDWLGLMDGRIYINENMAGTSLQPYSGAYKKTKGKRWSLEQTEKFYDALSLFGTDLMLVKSVFPEFTDKQIHDKFKAEEKKNKDRLDNILIYNKKKLTKEDVIRFKEKYKN